LVTAVDDGRAIIAGVSAVEHDVEVDADLLEPVAGYRDVAGLDGDLEGAGRRSCSRRSRICWWAVVVWVTMSC